MCGGAAHSLAVETETSRERECAQLDLAERLGKKPAGKPSSTLALGSEKAFWRRTYLHLTVHHVMYPLIHY